MSTRLNSTFESKKRTLLHLKMLLLDQSDLPYGIVMSTFLLLFLNNAEPFARSILFDFRYKIFRSLLNYLNDFLFFSLLKHAFVAFVSFISKNIAFVYLSISTAVLLANKQASTRKLFR